MEPANEPLEDFDAEEFSNNHIELPEVYSDTFEEIIQYAMELEEEERAFYLELAKRVDNSEVRRLILAHADEELDHRQKLNRILGFHCLPEGKRRYADPELRIADYPIPAAANPDRLDFQDALILAIRREQASQSLYQDLARLAMETEVRSIFAFLASQEGRHRAALEREYQVLLREED